MSQDCLTFQRLADLRLNEAKLLAKEGHSSGAYYLSGYAIECALKARIAAQFREHEIPDKALINQIYTHDLSSLVRLAGLEPELKAAVDADPILGRRWSVVKNWSELARYLVWTDDDASDMIEAIDGGDGGEDGNGIYRWLTHRW